MNDFNTIFNEQQESIAVKLITKSFDNHQDFSSRSNYFDTNIFSKLCVDYKDAKDVNDNNDLNNFIYDILVISKLYSIIYYLYVKYNNDNNNDEILFEKFIKNVIIKLQVSDDKTLLSRIEFDTTNNIYNVIIVNLFDITNLNLDNDKISDYSSLYNIKDFTSDNIPIPLYHKIIEKDGSISYKKFIGLSTFFIDTNINKIIVSNNNINNYDLTNNNNNKININFHNNNGYLTDYEIKKLYETYKNNIQKDQSNINKYNYTRILLYIDAFNNILNTNYKTILSKLKYYMYYYTAVIYNINIQYLILQKQNNRFILNNKYYTKDDFTKYINYIFLLNYNNYNKNDGYNPNANNYLNSTIDDEIKSINPSSELLDSIKNQIHILASDIIKLTSESTVGNMKISMQQFIYNIINTRFTKPILISNTKVNINTNDITTEINDTIINYNIIINTSKDIIIAFSKFNNSVEDKYNKFKDSDYDFYKEQNLLNDTINNYNNELNKYSDVLWYYRKIIIFGFMLFMVIILILNLNVTNIIKIIIYICILIIFILLYYLNNITTKEKFTVCLNKNEINVGKFTPNIYYNNYYLTLNQYLYYIDYLSGIKYDDNIIKKNKINNYISILTIERQQKKEIYKLKNINLENAIDIFKKTINSYYLYTTSIIFNIIILIICIILYILFPNIKNFIISIIVICIIISIYYIQFNIHKKTRMNENKYYWSYFNPSKITLNLLL